MDNITLTIGASKEGFAEWLGKYTMLSYQDFPTEKGRLGLGRASWDGKRRIVCGTYYARVYGDVEKVWYMPPAITFDLVELASERLHVTAECTQTVVLPYFADLLRAISEIWPEAAQDVGRWLAAHGFDAPTSKTRKLGLHGGTLDRVREAYGLIQGGEPKTRACKRVGIDPRTYDRHVDLVIDWETEDAD